MNERTGEMSKNSQERDFLVVEQMLLLLDHGTDHVWEYMSATHRITRE